MKKLLLMALCLGMGALLAVSPLPITEYDYATPENNVSPIGIGMGGLNLTYAGDPYASYSNPALLADVQTSTLVTSFRLASNDKLSFWQAASISNSLRDKQFKYFSLATKQSAWTYQPMARVHISEFNASGDSSRYYDYQLDKVQMTLAASDQSWKPLRFGFNIKYLSGRLVYLMEHRVGSSLVRDAFIDDKVKGFSTDLGVTLQEGNFTFALASYDLFSRLYWENYDSKPLQRRVAMGFSYDGESTILSAGLQAKTSKTPDTTYHLGMQNTWTWGQGTNLQGQDTSQSLVLRLGLYSHDFFGTDSIHYTLGTGYNYSIFRFDFSLNNKGMKLSESEYLFSLGVGLP